MLTSFECGGVAKSGITAYSLKTFRHQVKPLKYSRLVVKYCRYLPSLCLFYISLEVHRKAQMFSCNNYRSIQN